MKPLFDSEQFAFIGSDDNRILVHCRACGGQAHVEVEASRSVAPRLRATCSTCGTNLTYTFADAVSRSATSAG